MAKPLGYVVMEMAEDFEQALVLRTGSDLPPGGILDWSRRKPQEARAVFESAAQARAAITRTNRYRLAFARKDLPERKFCKVVPVVFVEDEVAHG